MSAVPTLTSKEGSPPCPLIGSSTVFNTKISDVATYKSGTGFLPVIPRPPKDNMCKHYLDFLLDMKSDQNMNYIFCRSDQDVFCKPSQIIWKERKYENIINIMGEFHILLVTLKVLYKRYNLRV